MKRSLLFKWTVMTCAFTLAITSCSQRAFLTLTPTLTPTAAPTNTPTETPIPPTPTPSPPSTLSKADFKSSIEEIANHGLKEEAKRITNLLPNAKVYFTNRGEICVHIETSDLLACGQTLQGNDGSTLTYVIDPITSWEARANMNAPDQDINHLVIPDLIGADKNIAARTVEELRTLVDLMNGTIGPNTDFTTYVSTQAPIHVFAYFGGYDQQQNILDMFQKDLFNNYKGYENHLRDPNNNNQWGNKPFWTLDQSPINRKFSRIVTANDGTLVFAHFQSGLNDFPSKWGASVKETLARQMITSLFNQFAREYINKRAGLNGNTFPNPIIRYHGSLMGLIDDYPPLLLSDPTDINEAHKFYVKKLITIHADSFKLAP